VSEVIAVINVEINDEEWKGVTSFRDAVDLVESKR
jgi:acyl carrier protein